MRGNQLLEGMEHNDLQMKQHRRMYSFTGHYFTAQTPDQKPALG